MSRNKLVVIVGLVGLLPIAGETQAAQEQMGRWNTRNGQPRRDRVHVLPQSSYRDGSSAGA